ncbi:MAG TPA: M28 family peptidase [Pyrinomonadaceae bacterium]|nr:M28 family peptidase [Pyrinomonadaceae bacterium]
MNKDIRRTFFLFVIVAIAATVQIFGQTAAPAPVATPAAVHFSTEEELMSDVKVGPCKNEERLEAVKAMFKRLGAKDEDIKVEKIDKAQNVIVTKKGKTDEIVVIGGHYDKVDAGCGIVDNWTGIVILAHLYRTISAMTPNKTFVFVAFDREELGLVGSRDMAKAIPKDSRAKYCSMVNLDSFGLGYPFVLQNASNPKLIKVAKELGETLKVPVSVAEIPGASSDSASFNNIDIPAITLSALSAKWPEIMHQSKDKIEAVIPGSVRVGYNFGLRFIAKMEEAGCADFK